MTRGARLLANFGGEEGDPSGYTDQRHDPYRAAKGGYLLAYVHRLAFDLLPRGSNRRSDKGRGNNNCEYNAQTWCDAEEAQAYANQRSDEHHRTERVGILGSLAAL